MNRKLLIAILILFFGINSSFAQFKMGNTLTPLTGNLYPIILSNDAKGGFHQVATITERNAIPALRRQEGMLCAVLNADSGTPKTYQLIGGILDTNWVEFTSGTTTTETDPIVKAINGMVKSDGTTISAAVAGTDYLSPTGSAAALTNFPILNQNTTGNAATATTATNTTIANDVATATAVYPTWVTANTGNLPHYVSSTKLSFVPSTGVITAGGIIKSGGTAGQFLKADGSVDANTYLTSSSGVTSVAGGATGLTPVGASNGAVTLGGTLNIANGGTGISTAATPGGIVYGASATAMGYTAVGTSGQVLVSGGGSAPTWTSSPTTFTIPISKLAVATATNDIDNTNLAQTWRWNSLAAGNALSIAANTTAAASNTQTLLNLSLSGANATAGQTTYGAQIANTHTGGTSTNVGLSVSASGGTTANYALLVPSGNVGIGTTAPVTKLQVNAKVADDGGFTYDANSVYFVHPTPTSDVTLNDPKSVLMLARQGTDTKAYGAAASFNLSRYENNSANSRTRLDISLAHDVFSPMNNTVMTLLSGGNVGIGTTSPAAKLSIKSSSNAVPATTGTTPAGLIARMEGSDNGLLDIGNASGGRAWLQSTDKADLSKTYSILLNPNGGNVGIGTTSTSQLLSLGGDAARTIWMERNTTTGGLGLTLASGGAKLAGTDLAGGDLALKSGISTGTGTSAIRFYTATAATTGTADNAPSEKVTILGSGNVGIGTTAPGEKLEVAGNLRVGASSSSNYIAFNGVSGDTGTGFTYIGERLWGETDKSELVLFKGNDIVDASGPDRIRLIAAEHRFDTYSSVSSGTLETVAASANNATRMIITNGGNVGIGTTSPSNILSLGGTAARTIWMERNTTANTVGQGLTLSSGGATSGTTDLAGGDLALKSGISTGTGTSAIRFYTATAAATGTADNAPSEKVTILGSGNVGIGNTAPLTKLHIGAETGAGGNAPKVLVSTAADAVATENTFVLFTRFGKAGALLGIDGSGAGDTPANNIFVMATQVDKGGIDLRTGGDYTAGLHKGTSRLRILDSGNVGIGTTSPGALLDVKGQVNITQSASTGYVGIVAPTTLTSYTLTLPGAKGAANQVLTATNASGTLGWTTPVAYTAGTGLTLSGSTFNVNASQNISTLSNLGLGVMHSSATGALSSSSVALATADVSGILPVGNGGTGISTTATPGGIVYGASATTMGYSAVGTIGQILVSGVAGAPTWTSSPTNITIPISKLAAAAATNTIDNGAYAQTWNWNTLAGGNALSIAANTTAAASNTQTLLNLSLSGANGTTGQTTYGAQISNTHTGATSTNVGLSVSASGGATANYAALFNGGNVGIGTTTPQRNLDITNGAGNDVSVAIIAGGEYNKSILYLGTPYAGAVTTAMKTAIIAEGKPGFSRSKLHFALNNVLDNSTSTSVADARMTIQSNGNIGIGTTSPSQLLSLGGDAARTIWMERNTTASTAGQGLTLSSGGAISGGTDLSGGDLILQSGISTGTGTSAIHFYTAKAAAATGTVDNAPSEKMTILGNGNVGIGTTTPKALLSLGQSIQFDKLLVYDGAGDGLANYGFGISSNTLHMYAGGNDNQQIVFGKYNATTSTFTENVRFSNNGNVGIGTTSPVTKLQVNAKVIDDGSFAYDANSVYFVHPTPTTDVILNDPKSVLMLARQGTNGIAHGAAASFNLSRYENNSTNSRTRLDISLANTNFDAMANTVATFLSNGNVGIGTTSPSNILSLGGTAARTIWMERNTTANTAGQGLTLSSGGAKSGGTDLSGGDLILKSGISTGAGTSAIHFYTATAAATGTADNAPSEKVTILGSGNVGIGNTAPLTKLHIGGEAGAGGNAPKVLVSTDAATNTPATENAFMLFTRVGKAGALLGIDGSGLGDVSANNIFVMATQGSRGGIDLRTGGDYDSGLHKGTSRLRILDSGNVGIGTTAPGELLDVRGNLRIGGSTSSNYIAFSGTAGDGNTDAGFTYIGERLWGGTDKSELVLFKGNDPTDSNGPDRIRLIAGEHRFDTYTPGINGSFESVAGSDNNTTRMIITNGGNVGIGTTSPAYTLDVNGDVSAKRYLTTMPAAITAASTTTVDLSAGNVFSLNVGASISTLTLTNAPTRPATFVFKLSYSSGTAYTITWPTAFLWSGGTPPTLTCVSGKTDILSIIYDGTNYYCSYALNF